MYNICQNLKFITHLKRGFFPTDKDIGSKIWLICLNLLFSVALISSCGGLTNVSTKPDKVQKGDKVSITLFDKYFVVKYQGETYQLSYDKDGDWGKEYNKWLKTIK